MVMGYSLGWFNSGVVTGASKAGSIPAQSIDVSKFLKMEF